MHSNDLSLAIWLLEEYADWLAIHPMRLLGVCMISKSAICHLIYEHCGCKCNKNTGYCKAVNGIYRGQS